jgi:GWxTD domain-containing protein
MKFFGLTTDSLLLAVAGFLAISFSVHAQQATTPASQTNQGDATASQTSVTISQPAQPAQTDQKQSSATVTEQKQQGNGQEVDPLNRPLTDKQRLQRRNALKGELKGAYKTWLEQDAAYIITDEERKSFKSLSNDDERESFIENFWLRRNPNPDSPDNEYREEHYRRIAYANEHFAAGKPGWKTDRGHIYISFGKPDSIDSHPSGGTYQRPMEEGGGETSTFPFEVWHYRYIEGIGDNIDLEFVDSCQCGDFHFTIDRSEKDALLHVPGAGATQWEEMGQAKKADRFKGGLEKLGTGPL